MGWAWSQPKPEVEVASGKLRGRAEVTAAGTKYFAFLGIPYAKPPVGELRFKAPEPVEPWTGVRDALVEGNPCHQASFPMSTDFGEGLKLLPGMIKTLPTLFHRVMVSKRQSEDCLYLNVFTPTARFPAPESPEGKALRPVLFWVHGGAFKLGDGNPDVITPDLFLDKDIVVVSINYRLGPLGFLSLGNTDVPGNAGLKDQALALRWTYDNIKGFGGDPEAITVYGESAGGASAHHLNLSPLARGLFRNVIASSGSALCHWATTTNALRCARALAKELGLQADTPEEIAKALRSVSANKIVHAAEKMNPVFESCLDELMFLPVVEPEHPGAFLTEDPVAIVRDGKSSTAPLMTGVCSAEGLVWVLFVMVNEENTYKRINEFPYYYLPPDLRQGLNTEQRDKCVKEILDEYNGGEPFTRENAANFIELYGDLLFMIRQAVFAHLHAASGCSPVYLYKFDFVGKFNVFKGMCRSKFGKGGPKVTGAGHGDDLAYLVNIRLFPDPPVAADSREMICRRRMVQLWVNFIETGNPTPPDTDKKLLPVEWPACTASTMNYLHITENLELKTDKLFPRQAFWERLYQKYLGRPLTGFK